MNQHDLLMKEDFRNLIILDACRFDAFEELYPRFLRGHLQKVTTNSSCTETWLAKNWRGYHDFTYVSGNPYVNSKGVPIRKYDGDGVLNGYVARNHFGKIIDVWKFGWSEKLKTVPPKAINLAVTKMTDGTNLIIHYVQPHWPYIGKTRLTTGSGERLRQNVERGFCSQKPLPKYRLQKIVKSKAYIEQKRRAYMDNLKVVLSAVAQLLPFLTGRTVISADHGELLGEGGFFDHPCLFDHPLLKTVPWFVVEGK